MASFRTIFKISNLLLPKNQHRTESSQQTSGAIVITRDLSFWRRAKVPKSKEKSPACARVWKPELPEMPSCGPSTCNKIKAAPKPKRPWFNFCKISKPPKANLSNCPPFVASDLKEESFWDYLFKFDKRALPDPCTCRLAYQQKKIRNQEDPRLQDPRFKPTKGDVLLYTELPRREACASGEPQPAPSPSYKLPSAVKCKQLEKSTSMLCCKRESESLQKKDDKDDKGDRPRSFLANRVPFEELRPIKTRRRTFSCEGGILERDIAKPVSKKSHYKSDESPLSGLGLAANQTPVEGLNPTFDIGKDVRIDTRANITKLSRFEQLQKLTKSSQERKCPSGEQLLQKLTKSSQERKCPSEQSLLSRFKND